MTAGGLLTACSFFISGILELQMMKTYAKVWYFSISEILELQVMKTYAKVWNFLYLRYPWTTDDENICQGLIFSLSLESLNYDDRNICHKWISRSNMIFNQEVFFIRLYLWSEIFLHQTWSLRRRFLHQTWSLIRRFSSSDLIFDQGVIFIRLDLWSEIFL